MKSYVKHMQMQTYLNWKAIVSYTTYGTFCSLVYIVLPLFYLTKQCTVRCNSKVSVYLVWLPEAVTWSRVTQDFVRHVLLLIAGVYTNVNKPSYQRLRKFLELTDTMVKYFNYIWVYLN